MTDQNHFDSDHETQARAGDHEGPGLVESTDESARPAGAGDDDSVFEMIANVESQLQRIRAAQCESETQLASLEERSEQLEIAETAVRDRSQELSRVQDQLNEATQQLDADTEGITQQGQDLDARSERLSEHEQTLDELRELIEEEQQISRDRTQELETLQATLLEQSKQLDERRVTFESEQVRVQDRTGELEDRCRVFEGEIEGLRGQIESASVESRRAIESREVIEVERDGLTARVDKAERNVGELIDQLEVSQKTLEDRIAASGALEEHTNEIERRVSDLQTQLEGSKARVEEVETEGIELAATVEEERDAARADLAQTCRGVTELESQLQSFADDRKELQSQLEDEQSNRSKAEQQSTELQSALERRDAQADEQTRALDAAKAKMHELVEAMEQQAEQAQRGAEAVATVRDQARQLDRLKEQLAEANRVGDPEELSRKEQRIAELTDALHQARGQSVSADAQQLDDRLNALQVEADQHRAGLERARIEVAELEQELATTKAESASNQQQAVADIESKVKELETGLAEAEASVVSNQSVPNDEAGADLRTKAQVIKKAAEHLRRRRTRLGRARKLLRDKISQGQAGGSTSGKAGTLDDAERRMRAEATLRQERVSLGETAREMARSERAMVKKWARPRAVITVTCFFVLSVFLGVGSWLASDQFFPATVSAEVVIVAKPRPRFPITEEQARDWQVWHLGQVTDDSFIRTLAKRFGDRQFVELSDPYDLGKYLGEHLTADTPENGRLVLTLSGTDAARVRTELDIVALTMASESNRLAGRRTDGARIDIAGKRTVDGQEQFSTLNPTPIQDERLLNAGIIFGVSFGVTMVLIAILYFKLARARRIFDQQDDLALLAPA